MRIFNLYIHNNCVCRGNITSLNWIFEFQILGKLSRILQIDPATLANRMFGEMAIANSAEEAENAVRAEKSRKCFYLKKMIGEYIGECRCRVDRLHALDRIALIHCRHLCSHCGHRLSGWLSTALVSLCRRICPIQPVLSARGPGEDDPPTVLHIQHQVDLSAGGLSPRGVRPNLG